MFSMAVWRGTVAGPLHWRAGWQTGSLARANCLECVLLPRNCPTVNYPNETMSTMPKCHTYTPPCSSRYDQLSIIQARNGGDVVLIIEQGPEIFSPNGMSYE